MATHEEAREALAAAGFEIKEEKDVEHGRQFRTFEGPILCVSGALQCALQETVSRVLAEAGELDQLSAEGWPDHGGGRQECRKVRLRRRMSRRMHTRRSSVPSPIEIRE